MKKILTQYGVCALAIITAVSVTLSQVQVPQQSVQAALSQEAGTLSDKFTGLARVRAGKYHWTLLSSEPLGQQRWQESPPIANW